MSDADQQSVEFVKYYTRARKFPKLLGRMPDGTKIPGGPYTLQQLLAGVGVLALGGMTISVWGVFGGIGNIMVLLGLTFGTTFVVGRVPTNGRNPLLILNGLVRVLTAPRTGRYQGRSVRIRRPHVVTHRVNVFHGPLPSSVGGTSVPVPSEHVEVSPTRTSPRRKAALRDTVPAPRGLPLTGVQVLLARADQHDETKAVR